MDIKDAAGKRQFIADYLDLLELKEFTDAGQFWRHLEARHDEHILEQLDDAFFVREEGGDGDEVYVVKNQSLRLNLDVANYSTNLYRSYFAWFLDRQGRQPERILDIGCDNGIVTCFYARLFPHAEVIGIDVQEGAIRCATELGAALHLPNAAFLQLDLKDLNLRLPEASFDLITSVRSFHEILGGFPEPPPHGTSRQLDAMDVPADANPLLRVVRHLLSDAASEFITLERLDGPGPLALWAKLLENAQLPIQWGRSGYLSFHELGIAQQMPALVTGGPPSGEDILEGVRRLQETAPYVAPE